jgi:hypothetical protein
VSARPMRPMGTSGISGTDRPAGVDTAALPLPGWSHAMRHAPRIRPAPAAWENEMLGLERVMEDLGHLPPAVLAMAADRLGVSLSAVERQWTSHVRRTSQGWAPTSQELDEVSVAASFSEAIRLLRALCVRAPAGEIERALWAASGLRIGALQRRERARRAAPPHTSTPDPWEITE